MIGRTGEREVGRPSFVAMLIALVALVAAACGSTSTSAPAAPSASTAASGLTGTAAPSNTGGPVTLKILASTSFTDALKAAKTAYEAATPGVTLDLTFGATETLGVQVQNGSAADVFIADDIDAAGSLVDAGFTTGGDAVPIAGDTLVLIMPARSAGKLAKLSDLAKPGVNIIGVAKAAPLTAYVSTLIDSLAAIKGYPTGFAASVDRNTLSREATDRDALARILADQGEAAFVYASDVASAPVGALRQLPIPAELNLPTTCGGVVLRASANPGAAGTFLAWLGGTDGQAILIQHGFIAPSQ